MTLTVSKSFLAPTYKRNGLSFPHGEGVWLQDVAGRRYLDLLAGIGVNALGHRHPAVLHAIESAMQGPIHLSNLYESPTGEALADMLCQDSFADAVFLCNSGTEAVEGAIKFARKKRACGPLVAFRGSFHGRTLGALSVTWSQRYREPFEPLMPGVLWADFNGTDIPIAEDTAAVIVEPVQGEGGVVPARPEFLQMLRQRCDEVGAMLIFDEVQCGLGRTGSLWAHQTAGVTPDVMTVAKPLGGGFPIGAILMRDSVATALTAGDHGSTFGGGPFITTVATAVLATIRQPAFLERVRCIGQQLQQGLLALQHKHAAIVSVRGAGLMWGVQLDEAVPVETVVAAGHEAGVLFGQSAGNTLRLLPPLILEPAHVDLALELLDREPAMQTLTQVVVRKAHIPEAPAITAMVNEYAGQGLMLPKRTLEVYQMIREFYVAVDGTGALVGCGALRILGDDLAEVRSLAVSDTVRGQGVGRRLVLALADEARSLALTRVFALTLQVDFFARLGFREVDKSIFPQKVWLDCRQCPKRHQCDETAMELAL